MGTKKKALTDYLRAEKNQGRSGQDKSGVYSTLPHGNRKLSGGDTATSYLKAAGPKSQPGRVRRL